MSGLNIIINCWKHSSAVTRNSFIINTVKSAGNPSVVNLNLLSDTFYVKANKIGQRQLSYQRHLSDAELSHETGQDLTDGFLFPRSVLRVQEQTCLKCPTCISASLCVDGVQAINKQRQPTDKLLFCFCLLWNK